MYFLFLEKVGSSSKMTLFGMLRWGQLIAQSGERGNLVLTFVLRPSIVLRKVLSKYDSWSKILQENMTITNHDS